MTGADGFGRNHISKRLFDEGWRVVGVDCMSNYYDVSENERREGVLLQKALRRSVHEKVKTSNVLMNLFEEERPNVVLRRYQEVRRKYGAQVCAFF